MSQSGSSSNPVKPDVSTDREAPENAGEYNEAADEHPTVQPFNQSAMAEQGAIDGESAKDAGDPKNASGANAEQTAFPAPWPSAAPLESPRMGDCAVNVYGWAIPIPDGIDKLKDTQFYCRPFTPHLPWEEHAAEMLEAGKDPWRKSFHLTDEDHKPNYGYARPVLLVGFAVADLEPEYRKVPPSIAALRFVKGPFQGGFATDIPGMVPNLAERNIVMVVAQLSYQEKTMWKPWAVLGTDDEESELGQLVGITSTECFYLPRFRDVTTHDQRANTRLSSWTKLVRRAAICSEDVVLWNYFGDKPAVKR
ncbi:hypothetical protein N658DRAFT_484069 [Parathielavia hyrcaniae]|uniref:Uncharacterized protein n=1 Tax=Parathielavia hyrcaniae TaxID=113614 RepID=A0AAN6Q6V8_9PEZI|nr:hypothetical protein N658DRAFT_484069 [Parathielavia hyrcaniae]